MKKLLIVTIIIFGTLFLGISAVGATDHEDRPSILKVNQIDD